MQAWAEDQKTKGSLITMMGDPSGELTSALGLALDHPGPKGKGLLGRCKRFAMYLDNGVVKVLRVSEGPDDPAGDDYPESSLAPAMITAIKELSNKVEL
jgi:peroxiredoxin